MWQDFKAFAIKGNVIDLAVAVVLGTAFTAVVTAIVKGLIMPVIGTVTPGGSWQAWTVWKLELGVVLAAVLNFVIVAFVLFLLVQKVLKALARKEAAKAIAPPEPTATEVLLAEIRDLLASRGR